jgi:ATPase subunit of ABC transporter with duplicated ATPase domains
MANNDVILRFDEVSFEYGHQRPILRDVSISVRRGAKMALMGQNGAGKSTIFKLIMGDLKPESGTVIRDRNTTIATARQVIPRDQLGWTVRQFFENAFASKVYDIDPRIDKALDIVNLETDHERVLNTFSGGQQARLLLAHALIQDPDIILLDEPTNNLDKAGIAHLTQFLINYKKTCIVISHDADFLNAFTEGVLYLESFTHTVEYYAGNYHAVVRDIAARLERERMKNARLEKEIQQRKDKANFFAQKGGHMRDVARKMRERVEDLEDETVEVRKEDRTIRKFSIPCQDEVPARVLELKSVSIMGSNGPVTRKVDILLRKRERLLLTGPNGIGKTTLLQSLATGHAQGEYVAEDVKIGYYRQDFSALNFDETPYEALQKAMGKGGEEELRSHAAGFLLNGDVLRTKIGALSEGQKGLVAFAVLSLQKPGLLILDEPTNHINFRHIPVIAEALDKYEGAMILVSHFPDFLKKIRVDHTLDLGALQ